MQRSEDIMFVRLYDAGDIYDSRCSGSPRSLRLSRESGAWRAVWANGPFDYHRVELVDVSPTESVTRLTGMLEAMNVADDDEYAAE